ncbi:MAG: AAA family ATPase, partial [Bacteroidota bacterium]
MSQQWEYNQGNPYPADVVIVDECSMLDQSLLYRILDATSPDCKLIFVGDAAQLPSVGPGDVLRRLIRCDCFPVTNLQQIYRQKDTSGIIFAAHDVNAGKVPDFDASNDFAILRTNSESDALTAILRLAERLYQKEKQFQVLSPRHKGTLGVTNLNRELRQVLNPKNDFMVEIKVGTEVMREGDRVMIVRNDYDLKVFNGDLGKIQQILPKEKKVLVKIFG